jgi:hypothetical protein
MALPTLPTMAWKIAHHDLPNRVNTSFTPVGNCPDSRGFADVTPCIATPIAKTHLPPKGGAEHSEV